MKNKILIVAISVLPLILFAFFWLHPVRDKQSAAEDQARQDAAVAKALSTAPPAANNAITSSFAPSSQTVFVTPAPKASAVPAGKPHPLEFTNFAPAIALENMRHAISDYGAMFDGNPTGENSEITAQLNGQNLKHANFIRPDAGMRINDQGQLVDPWGTPYFFHQLSGYDMEIHSAGPDKVMWTEDDLIVK